MAVHKLSPQAQADLYRIWLHGPPSLSRRSLTFHLPMRTPAAKRFPSRLRPAYTSDMPASFDTLSAAKELLAAGFDQTQTQAEAVAKIVRTCQGDLATKDDIAALRTELGAQRTESG